MGARVAARGRSDPVVVVVDSRERCPYCFERSIVRALPAGDYSVDGLEERIAIERKSKSDAYSTLGQGRARFEREMEKLAGYDYAAIVIESSLPGFLVRPLHSRMNPRAAIGTLLGWSIRFRVPVFFAGDREHGEATTWHLLSKFTRYVEEGRIGWDGRARDERAA